MEKEELDILKRVEDMTIKINQLFNEKGKSVFSRYPLTFAILIVFGVTMVTEGMKGLLSEIVFFQSNPLIMFIVGLFILIITGTVYKKLGK